MAHVAFDGAIRIFEAPTSEGWQIDEQQRSGDGFTAMVVKYVLPMDPIPLALLAKIYTVDSDRTPPEDPSTTDWRAVFQPLFAEFSNVAAGPGKQLTMADSLSGLEAVIDGTSADTGAPLRIRERRSVLGREQFIVTAMGVPTAFDEHHDEIDRWFSTSTFVPLAQTP